jgi:uncharacterized protein YbcI
MDRPGSPQTQGDRPGQLDGTQRSAISQAVVRIHAEHYGKGATQAKTYTWDDVVVTVLADVLTTAERTLIAGARPDAVRDVRAVYQHTVAPRFCAAVEQITGRRVRSSMSQVDPAAGYGVEVFVLEPPA